MRCCGNRHGHNLILGGQSSQTSNRKAQCGKALLGKSAKHVKTRDESEGPLQTEESALEIRCGNSQMLSSSGNLREKMRQTSVTPRRIWRAILETVSILRRVRGEQVTQLLNCTNYSCQLPSEGKVNFIILASSSDACLWAQTSLACAPCWDPLLPSPWDTT